MPITDAYQNSPWTSHHTVDISENVNNFGGFLSCINPLQLSDSTSSAVPPLLPSSQWPTLGLPRLPESPPNSKLSSRIAERRSQDTVLEEASTTKKSSIHRPKSDRKANHDLAEAKQNKAKARNRAVASTCRQEQKIMVDTLKKDRAYLEAEHYQLKIEHDRLMDEVIGMKSLIITHSSCNDEHIQKWIQDEVNELIQTVSQQEQDAEGCELSR